MKLSFLIFISCLMILKFSSINSVTIECSYNYYEFFGNIEYDCLLKNKKIFTEDDVSIEEAKGQHLEGKTNDDVTTFRISDAKNLKSFPRNINNVFKNLKFLSIQLTKITEITSEDLKVFPDLKYLSISGNEIKVIREDTFKFNPKLEEIYLFGNYIKYIDRRTFSDLKNLKKLFLEGNTCSFQEASNKDQVMKIVKEIENGTCLIGKFQHFPDNWYYKAH
ncbi:hypothetical protein PVAND_008712 [Polypedilum vanderplanki]|uniref:Leucine rich repeat protein n=1 Tax=Polypedilum vanderplanki TaxID=319348 RepID=A0A9J6CB62_POLVA|nr:hypothetical protein PVAND_008712 [Polypedilum vanderplanki]